MTAQKRGRLIRSVCMDVLLALALWFGLARLALFFGVLPRNWVAAGVGVVVIAIVVPAAWVASRKVRGLRSHTMVCDRCNTLKKADHQRECSCGGRYMALPEMKWVTPGPGPRVAALKKESHLLGCSISWKVLLRST